MAVASRVVPSDSDGSSGSWRESYRRMLGADQDGPLDAGGLERLALAAFMVGDDDTAISAWTRAHQAQLANGEVTAAARSAFWLGWVLRVGGHRARSDGWFRRSRRVLDAHAATRGSGGESPVRGLLGVPVGLAHLDAGDFQAARATFERVSEIGHRCGDDDVIALGQLGTGQSLIRLGLVHEGVGLFDELMIAATSGELFPLVAGTVYCAVILECQGLFDLPRAREWTEALAAWSDDPDVVPFRGQCLVHRSELLAWRGNWPAAMEEVARARALLSEPSERPALGSALYQQAELHRLRGDFAEAERLYVASGHHGREPQPGLALLRLAQGRIESAASAIRRVVEGAPDRWSRIGLLPAHVEISLAAGDLDGARDAAQELDAAARDLGASLLRASASHAVGAVLLAAGAVAAAAGHLRTACTLWYHLGAPYACARTRVLLAGACRELGDHDSAEVELRAAADTFRELDAVADLQALAVAPSATGPLSSRETEVLGLVAAGRTNRAIADVLVISERTVERHLSNIFTKLGVSNRAAATAYAYEHRLL